MQQRRVNRARVTIDDIAAAARVSRSTVSLVLRGSNRPAEATKRKVLAAAERLGYVYNRGAASLRLRKTMLVGVLVSDISNPFYAELVAGAQSVLDRDGRLLLLINTGESFKVQSKSVQRLLEYGVDGLMMSPTADTDASVIDAIRQRGVPIIEILRRVEGSGADFVGFDANAAAELATEHLIKLGHTHIAFIGGDLPHTVTIGRHKGFAEVMNRHGYDASRIIQCPVNYRAGYEAIDGLLASDKQVTACVAFNDRVALGVMAGLIDRGIMVGREFCLVGVDDLEQTEFVRPGLTTVATNPRSIGMEAANLLCARLKNPEQDRETRITSVQLVIRDTCGTP